MTMSADAKGFGHVNKGVIDLSIQTGTGLGFFFRFDSIDLPNPNPV